MLETATQLSSKIGNWASFLKPPTEDVKSEEKEEVTTQPQQEVTENKQEEAPKEKNADYKSLYENMQAKFDKQAKAIEISKRTAKENQKLKSQLQDSKSRVAELEQRVENAHDVDEMADLKAQIINEQRHQQELQKREIGMRDMQDTAEMIETKLTGFHSLNLSSAIEQQAELMGIEPQDGAIDKLIQEPHLLGRDLVASVYLIAKKDKEIADIKKELENLKIKHSDPQMTAIQKQSNNFTYNEDYNSNNGVNPAEVDKFIGTASTSELEKHLQKYKRS